MKNNTKIRLHISKQLFESITKQVLAESKANGGGAYTEAVKAPKAPKAEKSSPEVKSTDKMKKIGEDFGKEKKVTITLDEYTGDTSMYNLGAWAVEHFPTIANALKGAATGDGQDLVALGNTVLGLATAGSIGVLSGLAVAKDDIKAAAVKLRDKVKSLAGGTKAVTEGEDDEELTKIVNQLPADAKAKIAAK